MFQYHGEVSELTEALEENRERMVMAYRKVLGAELFAILETADAQLLGPASFQSLNELAAFTRNSSGETTPGANKFFVAISGEGDTKFDGDGHFKRDRIEAAPGFVFRQIGFEGSRSRYKKWISPYLAPYIHEYDHFAIFAIQERPIIAAVTMMAGNFRVPRLPLCLEDIEGIAIIQRTRAEKIMAAQLLTWAYSFQEFYELCTRILDREIFLEMGCGVPKSYFEVEPKVLMPVPMPKIETMAVVAVGDSLFGYSTQRRLDTLRDWVRRFNSRSQFQANFLESYAKLEIHKCSFAAIIGDRTQ
jgi:hypothetical protein